MFDIARSSNGRTAAFEAVYLGSIPSLAARSFLIKKRRRCQTRREGSGEKVSPVEEGMGEPWVPQLRMSGNQFVRGYCARDASLSKATKSDII